MTALRFCLAWVLFGLGDLIWRVFDQWTSIGMRWPIYTAYNRLMGWSGVVQGDGQGPWKTELPI